MNKTSFYKFSFEDDMTCVVMMFNLWGVPQQRYKAHNYWSYWQEDILAKDWA